MSVFSWAILFILLNTGTTTNFFSSHLELSQCSRTWIINRLRVFFSKSLLISVLKCTWSVDLKMCNFSNCSELFQVTLESIFRDRHWRRTHQAVCWNLLFITDLGHTYCPGTLTLSSTTKAQPKPRVRHSRSLTNPVPISLQEQGSDSWTKLTALQTKCTLPCRRRWNPLQVYAIMTLRKPHLHLK